MEQSHSYWGIIIIFHCPFFNFFLPIFTYQLPKIFSKPSSHPIDSKMGKEKFHESVYKFLYFYYTKYVPFIMYEINMKFISTQSFKNIFLGSLFWSHMSYQACNVLSISSTLAFFLNNKYNA